MKKQLNALSKVGLLNKDKRQHVLIIENIVFTREGYKNHFTGFIKLFKSNGL